MRFDGLPVLVLQQKRERSLKRAGRAAGECRGVTAGFDAVAGRFEADQSDAGVVEERVKYADRVGSPADACGDGVGQSARLILDLHARLESDNPLEVTTHRREGMRSGGGAETVVGVVGVGNPVAERLVDGVLEG